MCNQDLIVLLCIIAVDEVWSVGESRSLEERVTNLDCLSVSKRALENDGWQAARDGYEDQKRPFG